MLATNIMVYTFKRATA